MEYLKILAKGRENMEGIWRGRMKFINYSLVTKYRNKLLTSYAYFLSWCVCTISSFLLLYIGFRELTLLFSLDMTEYSDGSVTKV